MALERRGVPTVFLCPEGFRGIVEAQARLSGMPSYKPVTVPGHIAALPVEELIDKIERVADMVAGGLLSVPAGR